MSTKNYTPEQFARDWPNDVKRHQARLIIGFHERVDAEGGRYFEQAAAKVQDTGKLAAHNGSSLNRRQTVPAGPNSNKGKIRVGSKTARINTAPHGSVIDHGRKRNHYKSFSKLGGSPEAPRGISKPGAEHVINQSERLAAEAIASADAKFGK